MAESKQIKLIRPQVEFLSLPHKFRAYCAGYRAGKTWAGCTALIMHLLKYPRINLAYYAPTFPLLRDIFYPTIETVATHWGLTTDIKEANKEVHIYMGSEYYGTIICRSMEHPQKIIGYQVGSSLIDEIDTLTQKKADHAWTKIIARNSIVFDGMNRVDVTTTPEGFAFTYNRFKKSVLDKPELSSLYGLVKASTYDNEANLPADYIPSLIASYPENLIDAYLHGRFVNLTHGSVYRSFDRRLNNSTETIQPNEPLFIGMDFNVGNMAAVICVKRNGNPHAVDEVVKGYDTPEVIKIIQDRYWIHQNGRHVKTHEIRIYPDSSGASRKSVGASTSDIALLKIAGFIVIAPPANPPVKDRVNSFNGMICNAENLRRFFINVDKCPTTTESIEKQAYNDQGIPDKKQGYDHAVDAIGYLIHREYPLVRPLVKLAIGRAI